LVAAPWDEVGHSSVSPSVRARAREEELEELVGTVSQTFLGLTANCARCHDHKFDPIPQKDYYRLKAAFAGVRPGDRAALPPEQVRRREATLARLNEGLNDLQRRLGDLEQAARARVLKAEGMSAPEGVPAPLARWTFETDARDTVGAMHG